MHVRLKMPLSASVNGVGDQVTGNLFIFRVVFDGIDVDILEK